MVESGIKSEKRWKIIFVYSFSINLLKNCSKYGLNIYVYIYIYYIYIYIYIYIQWVQCHLKQIYDHRPCTPVYVLKC